MEKKRKKLSKKQHKELTPEELKMIEEEKDEINTKKATKCPTKNKGTLIWRHTLRLCLMTPYMNFMPRFRLAASTVWQVVMTTVSSCFITF